MTTALATGRLISHYRVVAHLGSGGMGEVYLAEDVRLGRQVALKVLAPRLVGDPDRLRRFDQEARTISGLNHPNVLTIYDVGEAADIHFIATEFIDGESLRARLQRGPIPPTEAVAVALQIAKGVGAAHGAGVVHRDLKPENVMVRHDGYVKVLDFGLAKLREPELITDSPDGPTRLIVETTPGVVMGTFSYMSPEQARGGAVDARSDLFSLGVILYEMLAGDPPFRGDTAADVLAALIYREPQPIPGIPGGLQHVVATALMKRREDRYQTVADLVADLRSWQSTEHTTAAARLSAVAPAPAVPAPSNEAGEVGTRTPRKRTSSVTRARRKKAIESVAVLPLENVTGDADVEYLSDGLTEVLINNLSQLPSLRVMARSTVFRYKGRDADPQSVGRELNVRAVLSGRLALRGDTVIVGTELIDVEDGAQLWGAQMTRRLSDVVALQDEISREITDALRLRLSRDEQRRIVKRHAPAAEAYQLYLKGRYFANKRTSEGLRRAQELYEQAIAIDSTYALAFAGLADCFSLAAAGYMVTPATDDLVDRARIAATRAVQIDESLAEGHVSLAFVRFRFDWDWTGAETEFRHALELNPGYAPARHWYAMFLGSRSRFDEALQQVARASELDPLSPVIRTARGRILHFAERFDEAVGVYRDILAGDPSFVQTRFDLALTLIATGNFAAARAELSRAEEILGEPVSTIALLRGYISAREGRMDEARAAYAALQARAARDTAAPDELAVMAGAIGEWGEAHEWLRAAIRNRTAILAYINVEPTVAAFRSEPGCAAILQEAGLVSA